MKNDALEKLFKTHYNEVKIYVFSLCRNLPLAEELATDAFYKAFISIDEEKDGFKYWLFRVARNLYFDYLRKNKKKVELNEAIVEQNSIGVVDGLIQKEEYQALYKAISLLKDNYKETVLLYYFDAMTVAEISGITGDSIENVKVKLYRARTKLKEILEDENEF